MKLKEHVDRQHSKSKKGKATVKIAPQSKKSKDETKKDERERSATNTNSPEVTWFYKNANLDGGDWKYLRWVLHEKYICLCLLF